LYSHHIRARQKIKHLSNLSDDYGVRGVFKVGRPGYIFVDGDETAVRKSVKSIKGGSPLLRCSNE
jgi:hypothetical protein